MILFIKGGNAILLYRLNGLRVAQQPDGVVTWIHADHLSSATRLTDINGLDVRRLAYTSFGEEADNQGTGDDPKYKYTGKEHDASGLYYYGARYYDLVLCRFITADTVYDTGPQGLNRYSYALNNPIIYRDPTGHNTYTEVIEFVGGGTAVWQALKEVGRALIPTPGAVVGGFVGAIPLILHARPVGEGSDVIPPPTIPHEETPPEPNDPKKPGHPPGDHLVEQIKEELKDSTSEKGVEEAPKKRINVGPSGHHVPAVRKSKGRPFEIGRSDKTRPTIHSRGNDPGNDHWRLHDAEREYIGPRQGDYSGTDDELFDAYRRAYEGLDDIRVDVKSPDGNTILGENVTPREAVDLIENWLHDQGKQ